MSDSEDSMDSIALFDVNATPVSTPSISEKHKKDMDISEEYKRDMEHSHSTLSFLSAEYGLVSACLDPSSYWPDKLIPSNPTGDMPFLSSHPLDTLSSHPLDTLQCGNGPFTKHSAVHGTI